MRRGQNHHGKTMEEWRQRLALFVRRNIPRDKVNAVQFVLGERGAGEGDVPAVDWVEGSAKKSYVHGWLETLRI
ncbi:hypothetical protein SBA1_740032 [Candidatus Sulfotelmatobacter kueseliae]|uniref:Uncharacterized protein n=1 Tax=Candidatus Sulfotelmatobacter kueseliae TaxID=2042962 RepID=A0A2U3L6B9_9BACT|nr:hypothetical protein SBA1_740032 [Candidatus Sulfotelmatobacter kueseliae]